MKFIFTADWHIRPDKPVCRRDEDWLKAQESHIDFVMSQVDFYECALVIGGDIFHKPQIPDSLKNMLISKFTDHRVYAIAGNHCLPYHSWDNVDDSSYGVLLNSGIIRRIDFGSYADFGRPVIQNDSEPILFIHEPIFASAKDCPPGMKAKTADQVLDEYPDAKWILCGDIHKGFHVKRQGRHLIMAGCLNRQASDFLDYEPVIWLIDTDVNTAEKILVPDDVTMVTDEHIQAKNDKEDRIAAFVTLIRESKTISLDFAENVRRTILETPGIEEDTILMINELMGES